MDQFNKYSALNKCEFDRDFWKAVGRLLEDIPYSSVEGRLV